MIELIVFITLVGVFCGSFGFCAGIIIAGRNAFENGRQYGWQQARRPEVPLVTAGPRDPGRRTGGW